MIWPGMGDPAKRKKNIKFLITTAAIAIGIGLISTTVQSQISADDPLKQCINNHHTKYKISATLEVIIDGKKADIPAKVGFAQGCQKSLYTLSDDGTIYAEWDKEYPFEIGHFLWVWKFPLRDMDEVKSSILVNGIKSPDFVHAKLENGYHYKGVFVSKGAETPKDRDFLPPDSNTK